MTTTNSPKPCYTIAKGDVGGFITEYLPEVYHDKARAKEALESLGEGYILLVYGRPIPDISYTRKCLFDKVLGGSNHGK